MYINKFATFFYMVFAIFFLNYVLLNLFLAVLLEGFEVNQEE